MLRPTAPRVPLSRPHLGMLADVCLRDPSLWREPSRRPSWVPDAPALSPKVPRHYWRKDPGLWVPLSCAFSLIASEGASSLDSVTVTPPSKDTTGANLIVAFVSAGYATNGTLTDTKSNSYTQATPVTGPGFNVGSLFYAAGSLTVGSGHALTYDVSPGGGLYPALCWAAFSGAASSPLDQENQNSGASTPLVTGSVTPSEDDELLVTGLGWDQNATSSINSSFTKTTDAPYNAGTGLAASMAYLIQTSASAVNPAWSLSAGQNPVTAIATFKAASGPAVTGAKIIFRNRNYV